MSPKNEDLFVDYKVQPMNVGDLLIMCSDGLTKIASEETLRKILKKSKNPRRLKRNLISRLRRKSDFSEDYATLKEYPVELAAQKLIDDTSFILIRREK